MGITKSKQECRQAQARIMQIGFGFDCKLKIVIGTGPPFANSSRCSPHGVERVLLLLPLDGLPLAVDEGVRGHDAEGGRLGLDHLELDRAHPAADHEHVALVHRAVGLLRRKDRENQSRTFTTLKQQGKKIFCNFSKDKIYVRARGKVEANEKRSTIPYQNFKQHLESKRKLTRK